MEDGSQRQRKEKKTKKIKEDIKERSKRVSNYLIRCIFIMSMIISAGIEVNKRLPEIFKLQISYLQHHLYVYSVNIQVPVHDHTHIVTKLLHTMCFTW